jgi:hypothetical protein
VPDSAAPSVRQTPPLPPCDAMWSTLPACRNSLRPPRRTDLPSRWLHGSPAPMRFMGLRICKYFDLNMVNF